MEELKPGRELDALIAEKVMGLEVLSNKDCYISGERKDMSGEITRIASVIPGYSTEIKAAWEVVEKIGSNEQWQINIEYRQDEGYWVFIKERISSGAGTFVADSITAPHAICLAALKAVKALDTP